MEKTRIKLAQGQRWLSRAEPELGLGTLVEANDRRIRIKFGAGNVTREYAITAAPLKRVVFSEGDTVCLKDHSTLHITRVAEFGGLVEYSDGKRCFPETELSDMIRVSLPEDRLFSGLSDDSSEFDLRYRILCLTGQYRQSPARGFLGGQIDLIPHQFYIAREVTSRYIPRVLLSDETGLGKTIEACLILHHLLTCERIGRVLIIVPESLVHQWFVELYRKFKLSFRIFNAELISDMKLSDARLNPFLDDQLGICSLDLIRGSKTVQYQILEAGWDMIVVDEAHHINHAHEEFTFFLELGQSTRGMMLLTATPEQMGIENHFSHLALLDPERYFDFTTYQAEMDAYQSLAKTIRERQSRQQPVDHILDGYGPGRVVFKNTRAHIKGFPKRKARLYGLDAPETLVQANNIEFSQDHEFNRTDRPEPVYDFTADPRMDLLADLLQQYKPEKFLLICTSLSKVAAVKAALEARINVSVAQFDETMTLIQRDRNAAWFSEKDGARILICSEIGSEGRNFQFSHHLFLFDLPLNPELLEQRIGRLDRIGQKHDIHIHVPFIKNCCYDILARWVMNGLNMFEANLNGAHHIFMRFRSGLTALLNENLQTGVIDTQALNRLIEETRTYCRKIQKNLEKGKDILLEINSFNPTRAHELISHIRETDRDTSLENLLIRIFETYGIECDPAGNRTFFLHFKDTSDEQFPVPDTPNRFRPITFSRQQAVMREDIDFINLDHPWANRVLDFYTGTGKGNCAFAKFCSSTGSGLLLETVWLFECIAPPNLQIYRFLSATPIRCVIDHKKDDVTGRYAHDELIACLEPDTAAWLSRVPEIRQEVLPDLLKQSARIADRETPRMIQAGKESIRQIVGKELIRLETLKKINPGIRQAEIDLAQAHMDALLTAIDAARLRLDSLRIIRM